MGQPTMGQLELVPAPDGFDPIEAQRQLQLKIFTKRRVGHCQGFQAASVGELLTRIRFNHEADIAEQVEMLDWLPWKEWKTYDVKRNDRPSEELLLELKYELVDRLHFLLNIALALGMTWDELLSIFYTKNLENHRRQDEGY